MNLIMSYQNYSLCPVYTNLSGSSLLYFREKKMLYKINIKQNINKIYLFFINDGKWVFWCVLIVQKVKQFVVQKSWFVYEYIICISTRATRFFNFFLFSSKISSETIYFFLQRHHGLRSDRLIYMFIYLHIFLIIFYTMFLLSAYRSICLI